MLEFDKIISMTKEYEKLTFELQNLGKNLEISAEWLTVEYWKLLKTKYKGKFIETKKHVNTKIDKSKNNIIPIENNIKSTGHIVVSWSTPPENCSCSTPVENVKNYMNIVHDKIVNVNTIDVQPVTFVDRREFSYIFEIKTDEIIFTNILESAKYILEISSATERDICNIGIYGKKIC